MNKIKKFETFLESLKGNGQDKVIEGIKKGFKSCFEASSNSRYVVQMEFFIWADDNESAIQQAEELANNRKMKFDDQSSITSITTAPFGVIGQDKEIYKK